VSCPEPPFVGKYLNSITVGCTKQTFIKRAQPYYEKGQSRIIFTYVSKDEPKKIYDFYKDKLLEHFKNIRFNFHENFWEYNHEFGIQTPHIGINILDNILSSTEEKYILPELFESSPLQEKLPNGGVIFNIKIYKGISAENLVKEYSWVRIYYDIAPNVIEKKMKETKQGGQQ
jgi:hypothetical protein